MPKRKRSQPSIPSASAPAPAAAAVVANGTPSRRLSRNASSKVITYQEDGSDSEVLDAEEALLASPSAEGPIALVPEEDEFVDEKGEEDEGSDEAEMDTKKKGKAGKGKGSKTKPPVAKKPALVKAVKVSKPKAAISKKVKGEEDEDDFMPGGEADEEGEVVRPPAVNDDYVPLPWKGRLGYACLNTYLRTTTPAVFCSRTCRLETIHKHNAESGPSGGLDYVKSLSHQNATDLIKLIHFNQKYNIKFLRISSEMFPFASHPIYGYKLEHAAEPLKEAGRVAMEYGHRLTMHPGQFTQLGSPRKEVVDNAIRDLEYHCELLDRLQLKGQFDKDAVMIIHMGGIFGDKGATLARFKDVYTTRLSDGIKRRLVLENDDVCWSVGDLMPTCQELGIPLVLDWHHNNIIPGEELREGTKDVKDVFGAAIKKLWTDKGIKQKMHYSEPCEGAITGRDRRKHSPRVMELPPCEPDMDLMIEAKDKEQAVFELMKRYKIDGWEKIGDVVPYAPREDECKEEVKRKGIVVQEAKVVEAAEVGMGGADGRVYWPQGMEEYLRPKKRERVKKEDKDDDKKTSPAKKVVKKVAQAVKKVSKVITGKAEEEEAQTEPKKSKKTKKAAVKEESPEANGEVEEPPSKKSKKTKKTAAKEEAPAVKVDVEEPPPKKSKRGAKAVVPLPVEEAAPAESKQPSRARRIRK